MRHEGAAWMRDAGLLPLPAPIVDLIGATGAVLTTVCWLPQAVKTIRDRDTRSTGWRYLTGRRSGRAR